MTDPVWSPKILKGGMTRCCIETVNKLVEKQEEPNDGAIIDCIYEHSGNKAILYSDGVFQWNDPHPDRFGVT